MDRHTPEKGSPDLKVVCRMSPTQGLSGLEGVKRRWRAEVGSSSARCVVVMAARGKGCFARVEGGGGEVFIFLVGTGEEGR